MALTLSHITHRLPHHRHRSSAASSSRTRGTSSNTKPRTGPRRASNSKALDAKLKAALSDLAEIKEYYHEEHGVSSAATTKSTGGGKSRPGSSSGSAGSSGKGGRATLTRPPPSPGAFMGSGSGSKGGLSREGSARRGGSRPTSSSATSASPKRKSPGRGGSGSSKASSGGKAVPSDAAKRLKIAETVMRKLYQRNLKLEEELASTKQVVDKLKAAGPGSAAAVADGAGSGSGDGGKAAEMPAQTRPATRGGPPSPSRGVDDDGDDGGAFGLELDTELDLDPNPDEGSLDGLLLVHVQQEKHLRRLLEERDALIKDLQTAIADVAAASTPAASAEAEAAAKRVAAAASTAPHEEIHSLQTRLTEALEDAARYQAGYVKARADYRKLVASRVQEATESECGDEAPLILMPGVCAKLFGAHVSDHAADWSPSFECVVCAL